jgi:S-DNA-T family DNA segregation ATPase FtsK/SpoIIIE
LGGYLGSIIAWPFLKLFGIYAGILLLGTILIISLIILFDKRPNLAELWRKVRAFFGRDIKLPSFGNNTDEVLPNEDIRQIEEVSEEKEDNTMGYDESPIKEEEEVFPVKKKFKTTYTPPPLSLLEKDKGKPNVGDLKGNMNIIQRTLLNFGISVEMDEVTIGPTVTRYALKPAQGVKLSRIVGLQNDLALPLLPTAMCRNRVLI